MKKIKRISVVSAALCLMFAAGCGDKNNNTQNSIIYYDNSNSYSQDVEGFENSQGDVIKKEDLLENIPTIPGKLNEPQNINNIEVKLSKVYNAGTLFADETFPERQVLAFVLDITNNTDESIDANYFSMCIRYINGEEVEVTPGIQEVLKAGDALPDIKPLNATIGPGESATGFSPIALYKEWESFTVYYTPIHSKDNEAVSFNVTKDMVENP